MHGRIAALAGLLAAGLVVTYATGVAAAGPIAEGDTVRVVSGPAPVKVGKTVLTTVDVGVELHVLAVKGDWVKVTVETDAKPVAGWVHTARVRRLDKPRKPAEPELQEAETEESPPEPREREPEEAARPEEGKRPAKSPAGRFQVYTQWPFDAAEAKRRQTETAKALGVEVEREIELARGVKLTLVLIPAGEFVIGSPKDEEKRGRDEDQKGVRISEPFWLGKYEVTQEQWEAVMGANPSKFKGAKKPVESVSWDAIQEFLKKANAGAQGGTLALPTEAQWEYACRAGTTTPFHFGETISTDQANYHGDFTYGNGRTGVYREKTMPVGRFPANAWGLHDMHGNVWEWCASPYSETYDRSEMKGAEGWSPFRVTRGGSWLLDPRLCRSSSRAGGDPAAAPPFLGFRVVVWCGSARTP